MAWNGSNGKNTSDGVRHEAAHSPRTGKGNFRRGLGAEERCPAEVGPPHDSQPRRVVAVRLDLKRDYGPNLLHAYLCPMQKIWYNIPVLSVRKDHLEAGTLTSRRWREAIPAAFSF